MTQGQQRVVDPRDPTTIPLKDLINAIGWSHAWSEKPGKRTLYDQHGRELGTFTAREAGELVLPVWEAQQR